MRKQSALMVLALAITIHLCATAGYGQHIYNKERDEQAQAALPLAQALKNGELFEKQLKNLRSLARKDFENEFLVTKFQIDAFALQVSTWGDAHSRVCTVEAINRTESLSPTPGEITAALDKLKQEIKSAKDALAEFKKSVKLKEEKTGDEEEEEKGESALTSLFARLGQLEELEKFAAKANAAGIVSAKTLATIGEITEIATHLKDVYDAYKKKVDGFNELNTQLAELRVVLKKVAIQSLQVDEQHWKNIASIRARREAERADILSMIKQYKGIVQRMKLVDFDKDQPDPANARHLCQAYKAPTNLRSSQLISDYLQDVVQRGRDLEKDNREVLLQARKQLRGIGPDAPGDVLLSPLGTGKAMDDFIKHIGERETLNDQERRILTQLTTDRETLSQARTHESFDRALRSVIIHSQQNAARARDIVIDVPLALHLVAALIGRGSTPNRLADVRLAQELHAYSIRKSAVRARAYELTIATGAQRLALFHKGGIKPTDIAQLVFAASNVAITPALLAR